jgi:hypothetical protein
MNTITLYSLAVPVLALACLVIVASCICRVGAMDPRRHRRGWSVMYVAMAAFAASAALEMLHNATLPQQIVLLGLLAIAANLALTHHDWRAGPPRITQRNPPRTRAADRAGAANAVPPGGLGQASLDAALAHMGDRDGELLPDYRLVREARRMEHIAKASQGELRRMVHGAATASVPVASGDKYQRPSSVWRHLSTPTPGEPQP